MAKVQSSGSTTLQKCATGIRGLDEITEGGFPRGRTTLVCGGPGCGKTLLAAEFVVLGITKFKEPGVIVAFEETIEELAKNLASLGFDLKDLIRKKLLAAEYIRIERSEIEETGEYDLEGLFIRLETLIHEVGAKRIAIDSLEALFAGLPNEGTLRAELRRLFRWLKTKGVTSLVTAERGDATLTRHGLEEYVSDCVILLDNRLANQMATRRVRVVKYRGSGHGCNEYPATIDKQGLSILPISSLGLAYPVTNGRVSSGIDRLDAMLGRKGYYRGSSILVSGTAGTGKSSVAGAFLDRSCAKGEKCLYISFEESSQQIKRNMTSIGMDLGKWEGRSLLKFHCLRPSLYGLETHLGSLHTVIEEVGPAALVIDPITSLMGSGQDDEVKSMLIRLIDFIKNKGITALFTSLTDAGEALEETGLKVSSLMDTWILLQMVQSDSERNRVLYILKSRGMAHSNQMREFRLTDDGIDLADVYVGPGVVLTGAARLQQEARDRSQELEQTQIARRRTQELEGQKVELEAQLQSLKLKVERVRKELDGSIETDRGRSKRLSSDRNALSLARKADARRSNGRK